MRSSLILTLTAAALGFASPFPIIDVDDKKPKSPQPGKVSFFYDEHCKTLASVAMIPDDPVSAQQITGGVYGTRSASWYDIGTLKGWQIQEGSVYPPTTFTKDPLVGQCVAYTGGVYVTSTASSPATDYDTLGP